MKRLVSAAAAALCLVFATTSWAQEPLVVRARYVYTVSGDVLQDAELLLRDGRIAAVADRVERPDGARVLEAHAVTPGFIDTHTHAALDRSTRPEGPVTAEWRAVDHLDLDSEILPIALAGGMTTLVTRPGSGVVSSGQGVALKLRAASGRSRVLRESSDLKMAVRPLSKIRPGERPATVMGWYAIADDYFRRARSTSTRAAPAMRGSTPSRPCCAASSGYTRTRTTRARSRW